MSYDDIQGLLDEQEQQIARLNARIAELEEESTQDTKVINELLASIYELKAQQSSAGVVDELEVWAIPVRDNGKRTTFYTEVLPFTPGLGVEQLGEPVRMVEARAALSPAGGVVLPERMPRSSDLHAITQHNAGWNSCLDEVARLNPCRAQAVADGWVLVPVEPTLEMMKASKRELEKSPVIWCRYKAAYRAMLAAAPSAKKESGDE